jgi:hypothetical protein
MGVIDAEQCTPPTPSFAFCSPVRWLLTLSTEMMTQKYIVRYYVIASAATALALLLWPITIDTESIFNPTGIVSLTAIPGWGTLLVYVKCLDPWAPKWLTLYIFAFFVILQSATVFLPILFLMGKRPVLVAVLQFIVLGMCIVANLLLAPSLCALVF